VHFDANLDNVALLVIRKGQERAPIRLRYAYLCVAPCDPRLAPGWSRLALWLRGDDPVEVKDPVVASAGTTLVGTYRSYANRRGLGLGVIVGGIILGGLLGSVGGEIFPQDGAAGVSLIVGGSAIGATAAIVGGVLMLRKDEATIEILPQTVPRLQSLSTFGGERVGGLPAGEGVQVRVRF